MPWRARHSLLLLAGLKRAVSMPRGHKRKLSFRPSASSVSAIDKRRHIDLPACRIEPAQIARHQSRQGGNVPVMLEIGLVARVIGGDGRNVPLLRQPERAIAQQIGHRDMDDVGAKFLQPAADGARHAERQAIFGARGQGDGGNRNDRSGMGEGGCGHGGREYQDFDTMRFEISDKPVQCQRDAVLDVIVGTGDQRDPKAAFSGGE